MMDLTIRRRCNYICTCHFSHFRPILAIDLQLEPTTAAQPRVPRISDYSAPNLPALIMDCRQILSSFYRITKERENSRELSEICKNLKSQGPRLDEEYKQEMDKVQTELVSLCQNVELDPTVRLEMLELIEVIRPLQFI